LLLLLCENLDIYKKISLSTANNVVLRLNLNDSIAIV